MKIAQVTAYWGPSYPTGSGVYAYEISKRLAEEGNEVHVFTSNIGNFDDIEYPPNLHVHVLRTYKVVWNMNPLTKGFTMLLRKFDFDVVHVHSYIFFLSNMAALARILKSFRYVLQFHGGLNYSAEGRFSPMRVRAKEKIYDKTLGLLTVKRADKVLSIAKSDIPVIRGKFKIEAEWVRNAANTDTFTVANNEDESNVVTYIGKLEKWKGIDALMECFKILKERIKDVEFLVIGEGSLAGKIEKSDLPIIVKGYVPHDKMPEIYHKTSVFVSPSYMEGSPTTCIESLACGVPVVATDVGDTGDIVVDGKTGFLVKPGDAVGMASKVVEIVEDESLRRRMGIEGRKHIEENFNYDDVMGKIKRVYEERKGRKEDQ